MSDRRVLIVAPGEGAASPIVATLLEVGRHCGNVVEALIPATENELRRHLATVGVDLLVFVGHGKAHPAAGHATLDFEGAASAAARPVNLRHLAGLLTTPGGPQLVVLQARDHSSDFSGFAATLVAQGVPAAITWPDARSVPLMGEAARRLFEFWAEGAALTAIARAAGAVEYAGLADEPGAAAPARSPAKDVLEFRTTEASAQDPREQAAREAQARLAEKRAQGRFDVFLCHNSADKPAVRTIARELKERGILPWLDEWELPPGQPWQPLLERQLESIRSAAVCVGRAGVGPWQEQELYAFLREFVARRAPVIPVLLPDAPTAPELPVFLRAMTYVDFRQQEPAPMDRLEWGITGVRPSYD